MTQVQTHDRQPIPGVKDMLAISSGKGGVGKSTISANLAVAMARSGRRVGLMDTDIYGPNIPGMVGAEGKPTLTAAGDHMVPIETSGLRTISMGSLIEPGVPVIWRGPMLAKMIDQFLHQVDWGELDVLVLDLPPGTGDVQITLTQSAPITGAVIVTTPSELALEDVRRGVRMFRDTELPIVGLIENMSAFTCDSCGHTEAIFGQGGGEKTAASLDLPFLGCVPLDPRLRQCADEGTPMVDAMPDAPASVALKGIAEDILQRLAGEDAAGG